MSFFSSSSLEGKVDIKLFAKNHFDQIIEMKFWCKANVGVDLDWRHGFKIPVFKFDLILCQSIGSEVSQKIQNHVVIGLEKD